MTDVLLIGREKDPHIVGICNELKKLQRTFHIFDEFSYLDSFSVYHPENLTHIKNKKKVLLPEKIKSVWNSNALQIQSNPNLLNESKEFVKNEWHEGILTLWNSIDAKWVNNPDSIINAGNRLQQLKMAHKIGLKTPNTLVTNDPEELQLFFNKYGDDVIVKTLGSSAGLPNGKMIFTTKISKSDIVSTEEIHIAPSMFQQYIPKKTEFRVTIIGDVIHSVEIHSQNSDKTKHDWRNYDDFDKTPYVVNVLPEDISKKLLQIMKLSNLLFCTADIIRTPDDEYYFLEINTNGRWWWIQELTGLNIAKDVAKFLIVPS